MIDLLTSPIVFLAVLAPFFIGAFGSLLLSKNDTLANVWSGTCAMTGSLCGLLFVIVSFYLKTELFFSHRFTVFPFFSIAVRLDALSLFFIAVISLIALLCSIYGFGYIRHYYKKYSIGTLGFFYNLFIVGMIVVVTADNGLLFLVAWEIMSLTSFFLVIYDHKDAKNVRAGYVYLVMTHVATAFIALALLLLYRCTGSFDFEIVRSGNSLVAGPVKNVVFLLAMVGFGTKAGMIPFHVWLPGAHPAAPSHVSALMSGVMIKTGIYMMLRMFLDLLQPIPLWWGLTVLIFGSLSSLLGVLFALTEHDLKKLLACHSIENIGIILLGIGSSMSFLSLGMPELSLLGLVAALFHTLNHATFKSLLFLSAGSVISETHTRNMEKFGGLIKYMPFTALFFLIGSMAISALPPFNGFYSEWLTFQALFQGIGILEFRAKWVFVASVGALAFTGGLALACFVKAFGLTFLARPRSPGIAKVKETSPSLHIGMGALAALSLLLGLFSGPVALVLDRVGRTLEPFSTLLFEPKASYALQGIAVTDFSFVSPLAFCALLVAVLVIVIFAAKRLVNSSQRVCIGTTWDCGADLTPHMEINSTGFAHSLVKIFRGVLKPSMQHTTEYHDGENRFMPKSRTVTMGLTDLHISYLYRPLRRIVTALSLRARMIQSGNINLYILYIFAALLAALALVK